MFSLDDVLAVSKDINGYFPDVYRIVLNFLEPSIIHIVIDLNKYFNNVDEVYLEACKGANIDVIQYLITKGASVRYNHDKGFRLASAHGNINLVKFLISKGADVNAYNEPLILASKNGHLEVVKILISNGANVNARYGNALTSALENGHHEVVKFLADEVLEGVDVKALKLELENNNKNILKYLIPIQDR